MTGLPSPNSLPDAATTRLPRAKAICTAPNSVVQSAGDPMLRLMIFAPAREAATIPLAASAQVIFSGSPTDSTGAPGNTPTTPKAFSAPDAADATSVPCAARTGPGLGCVVWPARSGCVMSARSSTTAIVTAPGAGGVSAGSTT